MTFPESNSVFGDIKNDPFQIILIKFPLDTVIINEQNVVVKIKKNLQPNRLFFWPIWYQKVLELPEGTIQKKKIKIGSKLNLKP